MGTRVTFLAPSVDYGVEPVKQFVAENGLTLTVLLDRDGVAAKAYEVWAVPTLVLIDHQGNVRFRHQGYPGTPVLARELEQLIEEAGQ